MYIESGFFVFLLFEIIKSPLKKSKQTPLWRITGQDTKGISYLLGTMHLKPNNGTSQAIKTYYNYIDLCEVFATEFPLNEVNPVTVSQFSLFPDGKKLTDFLPEKKFNKIEKQLLKSLGMPLRSLLRMKPLMIVNLISEQLLADLQPISMDRDLWNRAEKQGKELTGIETFEEQLQILERVPIDYQIKNLISISQKLTAYKKQLLHLSEVYESGDMQKLYQLSKKGLGSIRKFMIRERNHLMADRIHEKIKDHNLFCAIGAGHLAGKDGVLRLLKLKGLSVKPIRIR